VLGFPGRVTLQGGMAGLVAFTKRAADGGPVLMTQGQGVGMMGGEEGEGKGGSAVAGAAGRDDCFGGRAAGRAGERLGVCVHYNQVRKKQTP